MRRLLAAAWFAAAAAPAAAQVRESGAVSGTVSGADGRAIEGARVRLELVTRGDTVVREGVSDLRGRFRLDSVRPGIYAVTARRIGYPVAELPALRVIASQTATLRVTLGETARQLSAIVVVTSAITVNASSPELPARIDQQDI